LPGLHGVRYVSGNECEAKIEAEVSQ